MDKKKVTELIQEVISNNVDSLEFGNDKHNAPLRKANSLLHDALIELGKSDWVSVEDGYELILRINHRITVNNCAVRGYESHYIPSRYADEIASDDILKVLDKAKKKAMQDV